MMPVMMSVARRYAQRGKLVDKVESLNPTETVTLGRDLNSGMYLVFVKQGDQVQKIRITKTK